MTASLIEVVGDRAHIQDVVVAIRVRPVVLEEWGAREVVTFQREGSAGSANGTVSILLAPGFARTGERFRIELERLPSFRRDG